MRRKEFQQSEQDMATLTEILRHPIMKIALEIVRAESVGLPDPIPGIDYQAQVAVCGAFTAGAFRTIERLESLCLPAGVPVSSLPRQEQYKDSAKDKMREQGLYTDAEINDLR